MHANENFQNFVVDLSLALKNKNQEIKLCALLTIVVPSFKNLQKGLNKTKFKIMGAHTWEFFAKLIGGEVLIEMKQF